MEALHEVMINDGRSIEKRDGFPNDVICVAVETWRMECYVRADGVQDTKQKAFKRSMNYLQDANRIGFRDGLVWIIKTDQT
jgi:hypothetical protein